MTKSAKTPVKLPPQLDFQWSETDEPHATRRKEILAKHPEIATLFTVEPLTAPVMLSLCLIQIGLAYYFRVSPWYVILPSAYLAGFISHNLHLLNHDVSHNLAFPSHFANRVLSLVGGLATGFPSGETFRRYHMEHHRAQGVDGIDMDVPCQTEVSVFGNNTILKLLWVILQPLFYALRPMLFKPMPMNAWEIVNFIVQISFDIAIVYFWGARSLIYLMLSSALGTGLHPAAGHFIAEHYTFVKGVETYSYYGLLNYMLFNIGYHNEHHDFPRVPWTKLPMIKRMAPEYYDNLPHHTSYLKVLWGYITDPAIGPFSRIKRRE